MSSQNDTAPGASQIFHLSWPMTLKAIFLQGIIVVDGYLVSPLGEVALASMGLAAAFGGIILGVIFAFSHALQIRTAQSYGRGDPVHLNSVLASGLTVSLGVGVTGVLAILVLGRPLIDSFAPTEPIADQAITYLMIFSLVILGESVGQSISSYFNGCGRTRIPLYGYCLSVPINVLSSIALIHGVGPLPAFGVAGAAMGSALAILTQTLYLTLRLYHNDAHLARVPGWQMGAFAAALRRHFLFSLPIAATFISANLATHVCMLIFANLSLASFAALTLIGPWNMVASQISMQWTQASGIIVAQLLGQNASETTLERFLRSAWRGAFVTAVIVAAILVTMCWSSNLLYPGLTDETRATLFGFWPLLLVLQFPKATNAICGNTLRASGDTIYVMHVFVWSQWLFRVPATAVAVLYFDLPALWILSILLLEELVKFPAFHHRLFKGDWKHADVAT